MRRYTTGKGNEQIIEFPDIFERIAHQEYLEDFSSAYVIVNDDTLFIPDIDDDADLESTSVQDEIFAQFADYQKRQAEGTLVLTPFV